jgi:cytochrome P450
MEDAMVEYNPFSYEIHEDPYPTYRRLRDEAPAYYNEELDFWALSRFEDVLEGFHDWETYSSAQGIALEQTTGISPPMFITMDPPDHTRLRKLVSRAFTPRRIAEMEPRIREVALRHLKPMTRRGSGDLIEDFGAKFPMDVVSTMLGVPAEDQDMLREWVDCMLHREDEVAGVPPAGIEAFGKVAAYFAEDIERRRAQPDEHMISTLCRAQAEGAQISDEEIVGFCFLMAIAGNETTTKLIGNMVYWLSKHPDQRRLVREDPRRVPDAVEEVLRYDNSSQMMVRTLTRDKELHGQTMEKGKKVVLLVGSGNRDEREFPDPDRFDVTRNIPRTLSFGHGRHLCIGASLARLEGRIALEEIFARMPDLEVDLAGVERMHSTNVRGFAKVPIAFTPQPA